MLLSATRSLTLVAGFTLFAAVSASAMGGGGGGHGHAQHMKGISGSGLGTGVIDCGTSSCTETASGNFRGTGMGNGSFSATLNFSKATPIDNGGGGSCYGASGTIKLTAANGATLTLGDAGLLCEIGSSPTPTTFNGSYIVESGTGIFSNTNGTGSAVFATDASGNVYLNLIGAMGAMNGGHMGGGM